MLRRHFEKLLGVGAAAAFGAPVVGVGGIGEIADLAPPPLAAEVPTRIGMTDVTVILRSHREHLANLSRMVGGQAGSAVRLAEWAERWLSADCADTVRTALLSELAHLNVITGWCCHDSGEPARAHYHFGRAIEHATDAGDAYRGAYALRYAGSMLLEGGQPDDGLKALQLADVRLHAARRDDPRVAPLGAQIHAASAHALSQLDEPRPVQVRAELARARDKWEPPTPHDQARMDNVTGRALLHLGQFDAAQAAAGLAVRTYRELGYRRAGVVAELTVAQAHVQTRDPRGLPLARKAIEDVRGTRSVGARRTFLPPLADALEAWPSSDARELAREARRVAA